MAVYRQQDSKFWWYKFTWNGQSIRRSTKQTNKRVADLIRISLRSSKEIHGGLQATGQQILVVQIHLERSIDPTKHKADQQTCRRTDGSRPQDRARQRRSWNRQIGRAPGRER